MNELIVGSLGRSLVLSLLSTLLSLYVMRTLSRGTYWTWVMALAVCVVPSLLTSYAYRPLFLKWLHQPTYLEGAYSLLMLLKVLVFAALMRVILPQVMTPTAHWLLKKKQMNMKDRWFSYAGDVFVFLFSFLLTFSDFDLASLLSVVTWTLKVFDTQAGVHNLSTTLRLVIAPLLLQTLLVMVLFALFRWLSIFKAGKPKQVKSSRMGVFVLWVSFLLLVAWPLLRIVGHSLAVFDQGGASVAAYSQVFQDTAFHQSVVASIVYSLLGAVVAYALSCQLFQNRHNLSSNGRWVLAVVVSLPGFLGSLVLSLSLVALFQWMGSLVYNSHYALLIHYVLMLMPYALILRLVILQKVRSSSDHILNLLRVGGDEACRLRVNDIFWPRQISQHALALFILTMFCYFDVVASSMLAQPSVTTIFVRLYNFAHYGHTFVLSAMMVIATVLPLIVCAVMYVIARFCTKNINKTGLKSVLTPLDR